MGWPNFGAAAGVNQDHGGTTATKERKWYKKKRYILPIAFFALIAISGTSDSPSSSSSSSIQTSASAVSVPNVPTLRFIEPNQETAPAQVVPLSNDNHYTNSVGNTVHSPAYAPSVPAGASAQCRDGTYSFSQSRRGTCSHHGGVARWL